MLDRGSLLAAAGALLLSATVTGCGWSGTGSGKIQSWCQIDDPGQVEFERRQRKLPVDRIGEIPCAPPGKPAEYPDQLVLPMPCGRSMVFRAVKVTLGDALDSERALFGDPDAEDPFRKAITGPWWGEVAGAFGSGAGSGTTTYYIGKYEVTAPQFAVFANARPEDDFSDGSDACKRMRVATQGIDGARVLPAVGLSWNEATEWADRYSRWLIDYEKAHGGLGSVLPAHGSRPGYVRLPTEAEWEFAARDGREAAGGRTYEVADGWGGSGPAAIEDIAWFNGIGVQPPGNSRVFYVGMKRPNRLMLFDMLGNAEELVQELFRPVRPDGSLAGRPGGFVARGGSAGDDSAAVSVGARREVDAYDANGPARSPTLGFRVVLSAAYFVNARGTGGEMQGNAPLRASVVDAWQRRAGGTGEAGGAERAAAGDLLARMSAAAQDGALAQDFVTLRRQLELASAQVAARERQSIEELVLSGVLAAGYARERESKIAMSDSTIADIRGSGTALTPEQQRLIDQMTSQRPGNMRERNSSYAYYVQTLVQLGQKPAPAVDQAIAVTADRLRRAGLERLLRVLPVMARQVGDARREPPADATREAWIRAISDA